MVAELLRSLFERNASRNVDVAHENGKKKVDAGVLNAVGVVGEGLRSLPEAARPLCPKAGCLNDVFGGDAGDFLCAFGRPVFDVFRKFRKSMRPFFDEGLVVKIFLDDHMDERRADRRVGADFRLQMNVGDFRGFRPSRVDRDDLATAVLGPHDLVPPRELLGPAVARADEKYLRVVIWGRTLIRLTEGQFFGNGATLTASDGRLCPPMIGTVKTGKALHGRTRFLRVAAVKEDVFGAVFVADLQETGGNEFVSLVPTAAHPTRILRALRVGTFDRVEQAIRVVKALDGRVGLRAEGMFRVFLPGRHADHGVPAGLEFNAAHRNMIT